MLCDFALMTGASLNAAAGRYGMTPPKNSTPCRISAGWKDDSAYLAEYQDAALLGVEEILDSIVKMGFPLSLQASLRVAALMRACRSSKCC